ncbi:uncharacterized protein G2W53_008108 [Senna tora]|uniref:ATP-dependent DNA helicase n=1 Tax=Senna tora TaxID=362788 RepID=A0A835CFI7_9FABA|nr:uncharacterized protein G2W53_008108 [Senna tora]
MASRFDSIRGIHALSSEWTIKVRVLRIWKAPPNPKNSPHSSLEMVLCDREGSKIDAHVKSPFAFKLMNVLKEASVYVMLQFNVGSNSGAFHAAKHGFKLNFQFQTRIAETDDDESIERYGFEFLPASRIFALDFDHDILVDVIGRLIHMGDIQQASSDPKTKHVNIQLEDQILLNSDVPPSPLEGAFFDWSLSSIQDFYHATDSTVYVILAYVLKVNVERGMKQKLLTVYYSKYKVELLILDDSGTVNVTMFDKDVEAFLGISAIDLRKEHLQIDLAAVDDALSTPVHHKSTTHSVLDSRMLSFADNDTGPSCSNSLNAKRPNDDGASDQFDPDEHSTIGEVGRVALSTLFDVNEYYDIGRPTYECDFCGALFWFDERVNRSRAPKNPKFSMCCMQVKVKLPPVKRPPHVLDKFLTNKDSRSAHFMKEIRNYNNMFEITSMGGKIHHSVNKGKGPYVFRIQGHNIHISSRENNQFNASIVIQMSQVVDACNPLVKQYRTLKDRVRSSNTNNLRMKLIRKRNSDARTHNLPTASEVAALIVGDFDMSTGARDIIVENKSGTLQHIDELHPLYLPMQYPLLFPYGEDGYRPDTLYRDGSINEDRKQCHVTLRQFFAYKLQERRRDFNMILKAGKLTQQFMIDAFTSVEYQRTSYVRFHQKKLRSENYVTITEIIGKGQVSSSSIGKRVILPSSFTGGQRYSRENFQYAMTICATTGFLDLFITFTCNPKWPELDRLLKELGCKAKDRPDLVSRIFKIKLNMLIKDITNDMLLGKCKSYIYTIEFQKRGLPHAHILLWLSAKDKFTTASQIDLVIFAEIPNRDAHPDLYEAVNNFMIHGPCGPSRKSSPCMIDGRCSKHFPKKFNERTSFDDVGYCKYRRRDTGNVVIKNGVDLDNRFVVHYNPTLLLRYQAHINVEFCNQSRSIKYLFKYVSKGHDMVTAKISSDSNAHVDDMKDDIKHYYDCRYISPCEATWRIFRFDINFREPTVKRLPFHLPNQQGIIFQDDDNIDDVVANASVKETKFLAWFEANKCYPAARELTYAQMPIMFVFKVNSRKRCIRKAGYAIGCLYYVPPGLGELHYKRVLLTFVKGPTCFEEIRTINGVLYPSYKAACYAMGLLDDDREYVDRITEASHWSSGVYLRKLFSTLLIHNTISRPEYVWDKTWMHLSDDILIKERHRTCNQDLQLHDDKIKDLALAEIENILRSNGRSLLVLLKSQHSTLFTSLTSEQTNIYNAIIDAVDRSEGGIFFVNGFRGSGKTFIWNTLTSAIRVRGQIVLAVASSRIASQLIPGGRTSHSRFAIPLNCNENSTCNIVQGSDIANLLIHTKLIIWDEAPMAHNGKVVVFGGDFRQILPVIPRGSREDIVLSLNSSYLWDFCKVFTLTKNMRLRNGNTESENNEIREFVDWILKIGDGLIGNEVNDEENEITIPRDILIKNVAILAPTLDDVASINDYMLSLLSGEEMTYLSSDSICSQDNVSRLANVYTPEFLNTISGSGLPYHELKLKVGAPVMLLHNIHKSLGLCNGTHLIVVRLCKHVIEAMIISGKFHGERVVIAHMWFFIVFLLHRYVCGVGMTLWKWMKRMEADVQLAVLLMTKDVLWPCMATNYQRLL